MDFLPSNETESQLEIPIPPYMADRIEVCFNGRRIIRMVVVDDDYVLKADQLGIVFHTDNGEEIRMVEDLGAVYLD